METLHKEIFKMEKLLVVLLFVTFSSLSAAEKHTHEVPGNTKNLVSLCRLNKVLSTKEKMSLAFTMNSDGYLTTSADSMDTADIYVYNVSNNGGFVIMSTIYDSQTVLGYSDTGHLNANDLPENMKEWLCLCAKQIRYNKSHPLRNKSASANSITYRYAVKSYPDTVSPLLGNIKWNQNFPYNMYCPTIDGKSTFTGCVATAMAQILKYWEWPKVGNGSNTYTSPKVSQPLSVDFSKTTYDWANMKETYDENSSDIENEAVGTLMYHCGVAMNMLYDTIGSSPSSTHDVERAYIKYMGYNAGASIRRHRFYSDDEWIDSLKEEISNLRPVEYAGNNVYGRGAHAFVCDGYNAEGYFHVNWGWSGLYNGWFLLNTLSPLSNINYSADSWMTMDMKPDSVGNTERTYFLTGGELSAVSQTVLFGKTIPLSINNITNSGYYTFNGLIGAGLYDANDSLCYTANAYSTNEDGLVSECTYGKYDMTYNVPSQLSDGVYILRTIFKPKGSNSWHRIKCLADTKGFLMASVKSGHVTVSTPDNYKEGIEVKSFALHGTSLCKGSRGKFRVELNNRGSDYNSSIAVLLVDKNDINHKILFGRRFVYIPTDSTASIDLSDTVVDNVGDYTAYFMYDESNHISNEKELTSLGTSLSLNIVDIKNPKLVLTESLTLPNVENVPKNDIRTNVVHIRNDGAPFYGHVECWAYNISKEAWETFFDRKSVSLGTGEEDSLSFAGKLLNVVNGRYRIFLVYDFLINNYAQIVYGAENRYTYYVDFNLNEPTNIKDVINRNVNLVYSEETKALNIETSDIISCLNIFDAAGVNVEIANHIEKGTYSLDLSKLGRGEYIIRGTTSKGIFVKKIIIR